MSSQAYFNYPERRQGPSVPYQNAASSNPVLRGWTLAAVSTMSSSRISNLLYTLNKLDKLKEIPHINGYEPRYDPTVIPIASGNPVVNVSDLPVPKPRSKGDRYYTIGDYHAAFQSGVTTPTEVARKLLQLIKRSGKSTKYSVAFLDSKDDIVLAAAEASTQRYKQGKPLSAIDGVPLAVKDEIDLQGYSRNLGSTIDFTNPLDQTGWCAQKWLDAGAVILGKTNMHEDGLDTTGNNPTTGTPVNPHNPEYYTGGSSSGSASVVAFGICPVALGRDGGGSIRLPASFCGIYGLKPTHGRVSGRPTVDLGCSVGAYGPLASDLDSLEIAYRIMGQPDSEQRTSCSFPSTLTQPGSNKPTTNKVIGVFRPWVERSDPAVLRMFDRAVEFYRTTHGYQIVDIEIPLLPEGQKAHALTILSEARSGIDAQQLAKLTYPNQMLLSIAGSHASAQDLLAAQSLRALQMEHMAWLWQQHPDMLVLTPTTPCAGWKIGIPSDVTSGYGVSDADMSLKSMEFVYLSNWIGTPSMSRPMGYAGDKKNVPVGLMAMADWGREEQLLSWAREGEELLEGGACSRPVQDGNWIDVLADISKP